jgi:hypothetical protein
MLNSRVGGYYPLLALSLLLATAGLAGHTQMAHAAGSGVEAVERSQRKGQVVCVLAEAGPSDVLRLQIACGRR